MNVSVVIPTFNRAHQVGGTIRSVLAQTSPPHELIVIDDGSTDATAAVCASFGSAVRYVPQANAGVSAARNHGARLAAGDVLAFADSDDLWRPDKLAAQCAALEADPEAGWSITGCNVIDDAGRPTIARGFATVFSVFETEGVTPEAFFGRYLEPTRVAATGATYRGFRGDAYLPLFLGNFALPSSSLVRRELFLRTGGFDPEFKRAEETEFFHRLAAVSPVILLMEPLVGYRMDQPGSLAAPVNAGSLIRNALTSLDRAAALRPQTPEIVEHRRRGRRALLLKQAYVCLSLRQRQEARRAVQDAWSEGAPRDPWSVAVFGASLLPAAALGLLHRAKRALPRRGNA